MSHQTLADNNQFSFKCPIFNADTKMSSCIKLRNLVWKGVKVDKRKGCQSCMSSGKCPASRIMQMITMQGAPDDYGSTTPVNGKLRKDILERIRPVVVMDSSIQRFRPSPAEIELIKTANSRIDAMIGSAPGASSTKAAIKGKARTTRKLKNPKVSVKSTTTKPAMSKIEKAAASGDLAAAL